MFEDIILRMEKGAKIHQREEAGIKEPHDFLLQWGNRKRLRCMKVQVKDNCIEKGSNRADRRVIRLEKDSMNLSTKRPSPLRALRNFGGPIAMKGQRDSLRTSSPVKGEVKENGNNGRDNLDTTQEKKGSGTSSGSEETVWPKLSITLTSKEKEEDFWAIKRSRLPQRPKKRSKFVQRALNLVSPGSWLCDLSLERYEVRERKTSKKRPRGLKAMGVLDSDSD